MARSSEPRLQPSHVELGDTVDASAREPRRPDATDALGALDHPGLLPVERRHYLIDGEIAKGGMGRVLAARDLRLGRSVAIKELLPRNRDAAHRFEREARITARLQHPAIIHIYEAGVWPGGEAFYAMPRVRGRSLDKVVGEQRGFGERLGLLTHVIAVVDALAYAHNQRVIHRDLKPANVLVGDFGETVVIDWGLAKDLADPHAETPRPTREPVGHPDTVEGAVVGTPAYMPPEQARGESVDERADVYALGALLYHVLIGEAPYGGSGAQKIVEQVLAGPPEPIRAREPRVPVDLVAVVEKAMARDPAQRYASAGALAQDLKRFHTGQLVGAHRYSLGERAGRWVRRYRALVALTMIALVVLVVIGALSLRRVLAEKRRAEARRAALLEERGRTELLDGHAGRALVHLQGAMTTGRTGGAIPFLVADAMRPFEALVATARTGGAVLEVSASPDGAHVVTAGRAGVLVLGASDLRIERRLFDGPTRVARYDATGARIVTAGDDGIVRVWDAAGSGVRELAVVDAPIHDAALSPDGTLVAAGYEDGSARVWRVDRGELVGELHRHDGAIDAIAFSPDGARVVTGSADATALVWWVNSGGVWPLRGHTGPVTSVGFSPDGTLVVTGSTDHRAVVWDPETGKQLMILGHRAGVGRARFSPDGTHVVTASADHVTRVWTLPSTRPEEPAHAIPLATLEGHSDIVVDAALDARGTRIATTSRDRSIRLWDAGSGALIAAFEGHAHTVRTVTFLPDGHLVSGSDDGTVKLWEAGPALGRVVDAEDEIDGLAVSPDGDTIATGTSNGEVVLWRAPFAEPTSLGNRHTAPVSAIAFTPDGDRVASGSEDGTVIISGLDGAAPVALDLGTAVETLVVAPDGSRVAAAGHEGNVRIWSLADGSTIGELPVVAIAMAFVGDGGRIAVGDADGNVVVWDVASGRALSTPVSIGDAALAVASDRDGVLLAAGGDGDTPLIWPVDGRTPAVAVEGPTSVVTAVVFSADGKRVITGGVDGAIKIWDVPTGKLLGTRAGHIGPVIRDGLALGGDGSLLISAGTDHTLRFWDLHVDRRSAAEIAAFVEANVPWRRDGSDQVRRVTATRGAP